jgi:hypothetical protein
MKTLTTLFALAILSATSYGQTIKSLGYNTTNGEVVYTGTNVLTFTNQVVKFEASAEISDLEVDSLGVASSAIFAEAFEFADTNAAAAARTNLGLGATWLTNDNVTNFRTAIGLGATNDVEFYGGTFNYIVEVLEGTNVAVELNPDSPSQFKEGINISSLNGMSFGGTNAATAAATTRTNLGLPLPALTNTSNADMLSALGAAQTIFTVKTNDQTIINETNATTITDLTFATEPGARYVVTLMPIIANNSPTEFRVVASNAVVYGNWFGLNAFTGPPSTDLTNFFAFNVLEAEAVSEQVFYVESGTNAGSISVEFKSPFADTTNTIKAGSFLRADKMP